MKRRFKTYFEKLIGKHLNLLYILAPQKAARESLKLFITPRGGSITPEKEAVLSSAEQFSITVKECVIQVYKWSGGKQKVLLAHGWQSNSTRWGKMIDILQKSGYTVISLDAPAHGRSSGTEFGVPVYAEAIGELAEKYHPQFAIGHSIGASTLLFQQANKRMPGLQKMVLLGAPSNLSAIITEFQNRLGLKADLMKAFELVFQEKFGYNRSQFSMPQLVKDFECPALFIHDKEDKIVDWTHSKIMAEQWENSRLICTEGLGHGLKSPIVYSAILEFLKEK